MTFPKMIFPKEVSSKQAGPKSENFTGQKKSQIPGNSPKKTKIMTPCGSQNLATTSYKLSKNNFGKSLEDPKMKLKLLELTLRNPGKETSEGFQDFINHVSNFIGKKNPFKKKNLKSGSQKTVESSANISLKSNSKEQGRQGVHEQNNKPKIQNLKGESKTGQNFHPKVSLKNLDAHEKQVLPPNIKKTFNKKVIPKEKKLIEDNDKGCRQKLNTETIKDEKSENSEKLDAPSKIFPKQDSRSAEKTSTEVKKNSLEQVKKIKPSEIPLRKDGSNIRKWAKPVSLLMQKPLKEVESIFSIDLYPKKPISPIEELSIGSDLQSEEKPPDTSNRNFLQEVLKLESEIDSEIREENNNTEILEDNAEDIQLNRCSKAFNIPLVSDLSYCELDKKPSGIKSRKLDLEKVKSSSLTVLSSACSTLQRLESYHQQNISAKEASLAENLVSCSSSRLKTSFNSLKGKGSKKNLSARLSSKGNKPVLKNKAKKAKTNFEDSLMLQTKRKLEGNTVPLTKKLEKSEKEITEIDLTKVEEKKELKPMLLRKSNFSIVKPKCHHQVTDPAEEVTAVMEELNLEINSIKSEVAESVKAIAEDGKKSDSEQQIPDTKIFKAQHITSSEDVKFEPFSPTPTPENVQKSTVSSSTKSVTYETIEKPSKTFVIEKPKEVEELISYVTSNKQKVKLGTIKGSKKPISGVGIKDKNEFTLNTKIKNLMLRGTALKFNKNGTSNEHEKLEPSKVKLQIKIDINSEEITRRENKSMGNESIHAFDWLYMNYKKCSEELYVRKDSDNKLEENETPAEEAKAEEKPMTADIEEQMKIVEIDNSLKRLYRSSSSIKADTKAKVSTINLKNMARKKMRSDAGDRWLFSSTEPIGSPMSFQNKIKPDTKLRSGLTKSYIRELKVSNEKKDIFEDATAIKLKRRNSEPYSFRGFIWKRTDLATLRSHKASASSMTSSLKHLNTDELEDFIFWEALPQKMTSCWEMSLYHFKRPWSVLSCSVFKDNRESNTPGSILQNLRSGRMLSNREPDLCENERMLFRENLFDVEPSIGQKNIDIRNWLAALNFPTLPSTSNDILSEGNFCIHSSIKTTVNMNMNSNQESPKRRKVLPSLKFSEELSTRRSEEKQKFKDSPKKWNSNEVRSLIELIRRKSGGFVTAEQFLNPETATSLPQTVDVYFCTHAEFNENKTVPKESIKEKSESPTDNFQDAKNITESGIASDDKKSDVKNVLNVEEVENPVEEQGTFTKVEKVPSKTCVLTLTKIFKKELKDMSSGVNIWKYLFIITLSAFLIYLFSVDKVCQA